MNRTGKPSAKVVSLCEIRDQSDNRLQATARDQVSYIADLLDELQAMALRARASDLAEMLATARREAGRLTLQSGGA